jgi:DNA-binding GntR family transcriptional regulator
MAMIDSIHPGQQEAIGAGRQHKCLDRQCRQQLQTAAREHFPDVRKQAGLAATAPSGHFVFCLRIFCVHILYNILDTFRGSCKFRQHRANRICIHRNTIGEPPMKGGKSDLYDDLKRQILTMELDPDEALDEVTLSERYGLSRTPVREIFRRLEGEGYVDIRANKGARVIPMNHATLRHFFMVAPMIYAAIGRLAVQNVKPKQLADLQATQDRFRSASLSDDALPMTLANNRFHEIIGEMSGNEYLQPSLGRLLIDHARIGHTFFRPRNQDMRARLEKSVAHHDGFIAAIGARDEDAVVDLVFEHWELSRENMEMFIAPQALKADALVVTPTQSMEKSS